jgi:hypothetical protein
MYHFDSPAKLSLHEEVTFAALGPAMGLFNNLVMFDQHVPQASFAFLCRRCVHIKTYRDPSKV